MFSWWSQLEGFFLFHLFVFHPWLTAFVCRPWFLILTHMRFRPGCGRAPTLSSVEMASHCIPELRVASVLGLAFVLVTRSETAHFIIDFSHCCGEMAGRNSPVKERFVWAESRSLQAGRQELLVAEVSGRGASRFWQTRKQSWDLKRAKLSSLVPHLCNL